MVNTILIHRQFDKPWDLANDLPSKYGNVLSSQHPLSQDPNSG